MSQITVRDLDPALEAFLRQKAKQERRSLSQVSQDLLRQAAGLKAGGTKRRDLSALAGTWTEEEAERFERTQSIFEEVDLEIWQ